MFGAFSNVAALYAGALWFGLPAASGLAGSRAFRIAGVTAAPNLPGAGATGWNTPYTLLQFLFTAALLGPLFATVIGAVRRGGWRGRGRAWAWRLRCAGSPLPSLIASRASSSKGRRGSCPPCSPHLVFRGCLLALGGVVMPLLIASRPDLASRPARSSSARRS
jgi:hypothetical protein